MTARDLYHRLIVKGFDLAIRLDGRLALAPADRLDDELRTELKRHHTALLAILKQEEERSKSKRPTGRRSRTAG